MIEKARGRESSRTILSSSPNHFVVSTHLVRKGERDGGANAVSFLPRCLGFKRSASIKVRENNEAKEAAANCPRITLAKLPSLVQQNPFAGPCIVLPPLKNITVPSIVPENGLLHLLANVVVHDAMRADKESIIQVSVQEENATAFPYSCGGWSCSPSCPSPAAGMLFLSPPLVRTLQHCGRTEQRQVGLMVTNGGLHGI
jgi:hypothetical protein